MTSAALSARAAFGAGVPGATPPPPSPETAGTSWKPLRLRWPSGSTQSFTASRDAAAAAGTSAAAGAWAASTSIRQSRDWPTPTTTPTATPATARLVNTGWWSIEAPRRARAPRGRASRRRSARSADCTRNSVPRSGVSWGSAAMSDRVPASSS